MKPEDEPTRFSIIIPCYNAEPFLPGFLHALSSQSFSNWQAIFVDDGSTDQTETILRAFVKQEKRALYLKKKPEGQPAKTRNHAATHVKGEMVAFWDADDLFHGQILESLDKAVRLYGKGVLYTFRSFAFRSPEEIKGLEKKHYDHFRLKIESPMNILSRNTITTSGTAISSELFLSNRMFSEDPELTMVEDYHFWLKLRERGMVLCRVREPLVFYRQHGAQLTHTKARFVSRLMALSADVKKWGQNETARAVGAQAYKSQALLLLREGKLTSALGSLISSLKLRIYPENAFVVSLAPLLWLYFKFKRKKDFPL